MNGGNFGPVPARLMFLSDLHDRALGEKVRFLGCVTDYSTVTGTLLLKHDYPTSSPGPATARVNIDLVLSNIKATDTQIGEWVNIIGYITAPTPGRKNASLNRSIKDSNRVNVQAIALWSAGSIKLGNYERILEERKEVERRLLATVTKNEVK
ncbi:MAG: hypothetical protein M1812_007212 [Candelaria pacifica]|nr:MAG: hypothetical protein M1812_007212 [Candelaria pacifica]